MIKIEIEYILNSSPRVLFSRLSTATGLAEWFADDVTINDNIYTFIWEGVEEKAEFIGSKDLSYVRFRWLESEFEDSYFEFKLVTHDITNEISLVITDFVIEDEHEETIELWEAQVGKLKYILGA